MRNRKTCFLTGGTFIALFALLTLLIMTIDVQPAGQNGTDIGFAGFNVGFHEMTGVNMTLYTITDWLWLQVLLLTRVAIMVMNMTLASAMLS